MKYIIWIYWWIGCPHFTTYDDISLCQVPKNGTDDRDVSLNRVFSQTLFRAVFAPHGLSSVQEWWFWAPEREAVVRNRVCESTLMTLMRWWCDSQSTPCDRSQRDVVRISHDQSLSETNSHIFAFLPPLFLFLNRFIWVLFAHTYGLFGSPERLHIKYYDV